MSTNASPASDGKKRRRSSKEDVARRVKFRRGPPVETKKIQDKKLKGQMRRSERLTAEAVQAAAKTDAWLLPSEAGELEAEGMERTWRFSQEDIAGAVEVGAARNAFDLQLEELGPYRVAYTRSGRHLLLGGRRGHLALLDWRRARIVTEVQVRETTRDVVFLHNEQFFAAAQKKYVYIYDKRGIEVHCLQGHAGAKRLDFLPYHFLLCSIGAGGILRYQDTSTGQVVATTRTRLGDCSVLRHNPWNGVVNLGHANGTVTMWSPTMPQPLVRLLCHQGPVRAVAVDAGGRHLVTAGADRQVKVWDVRALRPLQAYSARAPPDALDLSQRGLLAVGAGRTIQIWRDALDRRQQSPYMVHRLQGSTIADFRFCPYEDAGCAGHSGGVTSLLVPGAGEANFDSRVADPFQGRKARREQEVAHLLEKLQPDMICLDPTTIGQVRKMPAEAAAAARAEAAAANRAARGKAADERKRMKGRNKPTRRHRRKQNNVIEERKPEVKARMRAAGEATAERGGQALNSSTAPASRLGPPDGVPRALHRFFRRGRQSS